MKTGINAEVPKTIQIVVEMTFKCFKMDEIVKWLNE